MSWLCSLDREVQATKFGLCRSQETFVCDVHVNSLPLGCTILPIEAYGEHRNPGYIDHLQHRTEAIGAGKEELNSSIRLVDECIGQFTTKVEELTSKLTSYSRGVLADLQGLKAELQREIAEGTNEAEGTLYRHSPQLHSPIAKVLREFEPGLLTLFNFKIDQEAWPMRMEDILKFEKLLPGTKSFLTQDIPGHILPQVYVNRLRRYDLLTGRITETSLSTTFTNGAMFCLRDEDTLLCAGGSNPVVATAYLMKLSTTELTAVQNMKTARYFAGIIKHGSDIYLFGGWDGGSKSTKACEKFNEAWTALPDMHRPRVGFSPCAFGDLIYLPEVNYSNGVLETFSVSTQQFKTHSVTIPNWGYKSVAFIVEGELTLISNNDQMAKWRIDAEPTTPRLQRLYHSASSSMSPFLPLICVLTRLAESSFRVFSVKLHEKGVSSNIPPMRHGREVFWVLNYNGNLRKFNVDTQEFTAD